MMKTLVWRRVWLMGWAMAGVGTALALLRFPPSPFGFYPACPIREWTGLLCPGCGGTRALAALLRGNFVEAWQLNGLVVGLVPLGILYGVVMARRVWVGDCRWLAVPKSVWGLAAAAAVVFGVVRNL